MILFSLYERVIDVKFYSYYVLGVLFWFYMMMSTNARQVYILHNPKEEVIGSNFY